MTRDAVVVASEEAPILFFDGVCGLCNGFIDYILARDGCEALCFAPLQGKAAAARGLAMNDWREASFVLEEGGQRRVGADAVLRVLVLLGGGWRGFARVAGVVPASLRDRLYRGFARRRYGWFGAKEACRIPTPAERARFLD